MKFASKILLATTSVVALTGAAQAQQVLVNQTVTGTNSLTSGNNSTLINSSGFGGVTLQAFQDAANAVNTTPAPVVYGTNFPPGSITQSIASGAALNLTTNNTNAGFSANGAQFVLGSQDISSDINLAGVTLGNGSAVTVQQNNLGAIAATQNNRMSAGYNTPSAGSFGIGQGPAAIQGQSVGSGGVINNFGFQNNGFNLNTTAIAIGGASATVGVAQNAGAIGTTQTNFADAGQASPTFIDPSITALNQSVSANVNRIESIGIPGSTLILDGAGVNVGKQAIGATEADFFFVQNAARALTWGSTSGSTAAGFSSTSGGTGDVSIQGSNQTVGLNFNGIVAGTTTTPQSVNFGGTSAGLFDQTATYGSATTSTTGIVIENATTGGFANFAVTQGSNNDAPVNLAFAGTSNGSASLTDVSQTASASLNSALVTGAVNGNLTQTARINTETNSGTSAAPQANGPQLSNFAGAVVQGTAGQVQGPASLSNIDQISGLSSNSLSAASVGADGLTLNQTGYQTKSPNFPSSFSTSANLTTVNPGLSSNVIVAGTSGATSLGSNASITDANQSLVNTQNTFSAASSATGPGNTPAQLNVAQNLTAPSFGSGGSATFPDQAFGGDNFAQASAGSGGGNGSLSNGSQLGNVNLNSVAIGSTGANTQAAITQATNGTSGDPVSIAGFNTGLATGKTATIIGYGQEYDVALNSVSLGGGGAKNVTQTSGGATINTGNTLTATEGVTPSPFGSATIGGMMGASQSLTASVNAANVGGVGSLVQTAGPINSTLNNSATATTATSAASSITGLIQTTSQSINTGL